MKGLINIMLTLSLCFLFSKTHAINWLNARDWEEVKTIAKRENKPIFINCYATWCIPCKNMEKEVFEDISVASYFDNHFISIKLQLDSTQTDTESIQRWLSFAKQMIDKYKVDQVPSFLFFSVEGDILHQFSGALDSEEMILCGKNALDPNKQLYTLMNKFQSGNLDLQRYGYLAKLFLNIRQDSSASVIAHEFIHKMMLSGNEKHLVSGKNLDFMSAFASNSAAEAFQIIKRNKNLIESNINDRRVIENVFNRIIENEVIKPVEATYKTKEEEPDWNNILRTMIDITGEVKVSEKMIIALKLRWYTYSQNNYYLYKCMMRRVSTFPVDNPVTYNNTAFTVFQYSDSRIELSQALMWVEAALNMAKSRPLFILDTKANLLYKLGFKKEAIELASEIVKMPGGNSEEYLTNWEKMKGDLPTWPTK